jgi:hypothetical protein
MPFSATENLSVLQSVLPIITLTRCVMLVLRPDQDGMSLRADHCSDLLPSRTLYHELATIHFFLVQIIEVDSAVFIVFYHHCSMLPCQEVEGT